MMTIEEIGDRIADLTLVQAVQLGKYLEEVHGIKAHQGVPEFHDEEPPEPEAPPQTEFDVVYEGFDEKSKIGVIKTVREITGLGLKEAKEFVETQAGKKIKEALQKTAAEELLKKLTDSGAKASIQ